MALFEKLACNQAGITAFEQLSGKVPRLQKIAADSGYKGTFITHIQQVYGWQVKIAQKPESQKGFCPIRTTGGK